MTFATVARARGIPENSLAELNHRLRKLIAKGYMQALKDLRSKDLELQLSAWEFLLSDDAALWLKFNDLDYCPWSPVEKGIKMGKQNFTYAP